MGGGGVRVSVGFRVRDTYNWSAEMDAEVSRQDNAFIHVHTYIALTLTLTHSP